MQNDLDAYREYPVIDGPVKLQHIQVFHGANYFSGGPIVLFRIDLDEFDEVFTNQIEGFYDALIKYLPSLYEHHCSVGKPGGFLQRVQEGTLLGHVTEHIAIELQTLAGMDVGYGKTRSTLEQGVYNVIFRFFDEEVGIYAGKAALNLVNSILTKKEFDVFSIIEALVMIREFRMLGPSTQAIVDEASRRKIPWIRIDKYNLIQLGTGKFRKFVRATITSDTNLISVETADNKYLTSVMLLDAGIPVPKSVKTDDVEQGKVFFREQNAPVVAKPVAGYLGKNTTVNINNEPSLEKAFLLAKENTDEVIVQQHVSGNNYRLLIIDYKMVAAAKLIPPCVTGDGKSTIPQLIEKLNEKEKREFGDKAALTRIEIEITTKRIVADQGFDLEQVIPENTVIQLKKTGNPKVGGYAVDVTDRVHAFNRYLAERAARTIDLNVAGVDIIAPDISGPIDQNGGVVLEINAAPDFKMHLLPADGEGRNVAAPLLNMMFPESNKNRIPLISVTGTTGKTITVRLIDYCLRKSGLNTGLATSDGLYINGNLLKSGNMTYPEHVDLVLKDPTVECAVLETSREGILRRGLGYEYADIGVFLNIYDEHVGKDDIKYLEDLAYAKSVVAEQVYDDGYSILNADQELVFDASERVYSNLVLFSESAENPLMIGHLKDGGKAVYINEGKIVYQSDKPVEVVKLNDVPLSFNNQAKLVYQPLLAAVAVLVVHGMKPEEIKQHLISFKPTPELLPGRLNMMKIKGKDVLLDNAHNAAGYKALKDFLMHFKTKKTGVIDAAGDRSDREIIDMGKLAAQTYDELIFYEGIDLRGRQPGEILALLAKGAKSADRQQPEIRLVSEPENAWRTGLDITKPGEMLVILTPRPLETLKVLNS